MAYEFERKQRLAILGGGPGGYEAAIAGAQLGAEVTLVERAGIGGSAVLTDVVPSKTLIATAEAANAIGEAADLGVQFFTRSEAGRSIRPRSAVNLAAVNARLMRLAQQQSDDMKSQLDQGRACGSSRARAGSTGRRRLVVVHRQERARRRLSTSTRSRRTPSSSQSASSPRILPSAVPDGERILTWTQLYTLDETPEHLIVVGSGVTGAEFASAYTALGSQGDAGLQPRPGAAGRGRGCGARDRGRVQAQRHDRAVEVPRGVGRAVGDGVVVTLADGRTVEGSHCLMAVGSIPNTAGIGLEEAGVQLTDSGHIRVNRVARTSMPTIYAAGDCTDFLPLASVASMQGRTAVFHAMGDAVIADRAAQRDVEHLHAARDRDRGVVAEADRGRDRAGRHLQAAAGIQSRAPR